MKRKILFFVPSLLTGGAERQLTILVRRIAEESFEPHVAVFRGGGHFWEDLRGYPRCHLYDVKRKGRWDFNIVWKLARYIRENDIDLIQGWMPPANTFAAVAGLLTRRPVIMGVRASNLDYPTWGGNLYVRTDGMLGRYSKAIVCNSTSGAEYHRERGYPAGKLRVIENGVELPEDRFFPAPFQHSPPWNIGILARFDPMKDHRNMFSAMKILKESGENYILHLYGDGPDEYIRFLRGLALKLGISELIRWHGKQADSWKALSEVDLLVSSSSYGEGMSNSIMEAMAAGRAVIATDVGDSRLLLLGGEKPCGIVVAPRDSAALARVILKFTHNVDQARIYADNARMRVREQYSASQMLKRYVILYESVLGAGARAESLDKI